MKASFSDTRLPEFITPNPFITPSDTSAEIDVQGVVITLAVDVHIARKPHCGDLKKAAEFGDSYMLNDHSKFPVPSAYSG